MRQGNVSLLRAFDAIIVHTRQAERQLAVVDIVWVRMYRILHGLLGHHGRKVCVPSDSPPKIAQVCFSC